MKTTAQRARHVANTLVESGSVPPENFHHVRDAVAAELHEAEKEQGADHARKLLEAFRLKYQGAADDDVMQKQWRELMTWARGEVGPTCWKCGEAIKNLDGELAAQPCGHSTMARAGRRNIGQLGDDWTGYHRKEFERLAEREGWPESWPRWPPNWAAP